ncbi:iron transporter [Sphingomonas sp. BE138]|uniref:iron transporter n=1 Tax=Sphingomonas sp. BE138 TaxID=2817845 RepID=UPI00286D1E5F|nr:iron transporter [Sphingomonas sp. BE138]
MQRIEPLRKPVSPGRHGRSAAAALVLRCLTAFLGGYALTAALATLVARLLPLSRVEATVWAMVPAFLVYALVALWCFHEPRALRVAAAVWGGALVVGALVWLLGVRP